MTNKIKKKKKKKKEKEKKVHGQRWVLVKDVKRKNSQIHWG
jgi:membrane protein implicated in regulation of membrane protease activity